MAIGSLTSNPAATPSASALLGSALGGGTQPGAQPAAKKAAAGAGADGAKAASQLGNAASASDQSDRFLKLLVAQMKNQDPLNPMDSAQVTSQMAQISTVQGVQTLNTTVSGLNAQFTQLQTMQGASLVGHDVATAGNRVRVDEASGKGDGGFELATPATDVSVDVIDVTGHSVGTVHLGAQDAGRHDFTADIPKAAQGQPVTFKVTARNGDQEIEARPLAYDSIQAVSTRNGALSLELGSGKTVAYDEVSAFL